MSVEAFNSSFLLTAFLAVSIFSGCSSKPAPTPIAGSTDTKFAVIASDVPRELNPSVPQSDLNELSRGNSDFAFDLYKQLKSGRGNLFFSPYSISMDMAMLYAGTRGQSEKDIATAFHFTLDQARLHPAMNALDQELQTRGKGPFYPEVEKEINEPLFQFDTANALWGPSKDDYLQDYIDLIARNYGADLCTLDFSADQASCLQVINDWVNRKTNGKIQAMLGPGDIKPKTVVVLTNAAYFKARWEYPFNEKKTAPGWFHPPLRLPERVPMMEYHDQSTEFLYSSGENWQAFNLSYDLDGLGLGSFTYEPSGGFVRGQDLSMIVILPNPGKLEDFERSFDRSKLESIIDAFEPSGLHLFFPKFAFSWKKSLKNELSVLGMGGVFDNVDVSGMLKKPEGIWIDDVIHGAYVSVDEKGTEAAAGTGIEEVKGDSVQVELKVDHPFIFVIRDNSTGTILFMGRVMNPLGT
jgi:serpin B